MSNPHKTKWVKLNKKVFFYQFEIIFKKFFQFQKNNQNVNYPRTIFFKYFINIIKENKEIKKYKKLNVTIKDKNYFVDYFVSERKKK